MDFEQQSSSMNMYIYNAERIVFKKHRNSLLNECKLYSCVGRKRNYSSTSNYRDTFKIASASADIIVLFQYNENLIGYQPVAALKNIQKNELHDTNQSIINDFEQSFDAYVQSRAFFGTKNTTVNRQRRRFYPRK